MNGITVNHIKAVRNFLLADAGAESTFADAQEAGAAVAELLTQDWIDASAQYFTTHHWSPDDIIELANGPFANLYEHIYRCAELIGLHLDDDHMRERAQRLVGVAAQSAGRRIGGDLGARVLGTELHRALIVDAYARLLNAQDPDVSSDTVRELLTKGLKLIDEMEA